MPASCALASRLLNCIAVPPSATELKAPHFAQMPAAHSGFRQSTPQRPCVASSCCLFLLLKPRPLPVEQTRSHRLLCDLRRDDFGAAQLPAGISLPFPFSRRLLGRERSFFSPPTLSPSLMHADGFLVPPEWLRCSLFHFFLRNCVDCGSSLLRALTPSPHYSASLHSATSPSTKSHRVRKPPSRRGSHPRTSIHLLLSCSIALSNTPHARTCDTMPQ